MTGFLICTVALLYPVISDRWNRYRDMQLITEYNEMIKNTDPTVYNNLVKEAEEYNKQLVQQNRSIITDAEYTHDQKYESMLNVMNNGMMCYVEIPVIDITEPVYHYSDDISLNKGVGHIHGSSLPVGGLNTHSILTGHRGLPNQKFFSDLDKVEVGNRFYVHILGRVLAYEVFDIRVVEPTDVSGLLIEDGKDLLTLVTCEPYGVNTHRLIVTGRRVPFDQNNVENGLVTVEKHQVRIDPAVWVAMGFMLFFIFIVVNSLVGRLISRKKSKKGGSA